MKRLLYFSLMISLALTACGPRLSAAPTTLTYGLTLVPTGIDPHLNASAELGIPLTSVYDTLVYLDPATHAFVPGLAKAWEVAPDGLTYTFHLRSDVKFHDGTSFNAQAVCVNLDRIANPDNKSQKAAGMLGPQGNYQSCEAPDAQTASLHLKQSYAPLLDSLSQVYFGMASPAALAKWSNADYQFHQVGTGPFKFVEYVPSDHLTLTRNPEYAWGPSVYTNRGPAHLETITFKFYEDPATRAVALESGAVQIIGEVLPQDAARLASDKRFQLHATPIPGQPLQIFLNTQRAPTNDEHVRRALVLGVDRAGLVKAIFGDYSPVATGPLSAATFGYSAEAAAPAYDSQQAAALLAEAGWQDTNGDKILDKDGTDLSVDLVFSPLGLMPQAAQVIQANWEALGVKVNSQQVANFLALKDAQASGAYNAISLNFFGSDPDLLRAWFASKGFLNWSKVNDAELDTLLTNGFLTNEPAKRASIYADVQKRINDQALIIPLRDYVNLNLASAKVTGLHYNAQGWFPWLVDVAVEP
jgi:peptide/nickel transport system substrate-binding protein